MRKPRSISKKRKAKFGELNSTVFGRRIDGRSELKYADWY